MTVKYDLLYHYVAPGSGFRIKLAVTEDIPPRDADAIVRTFIRTRVEDADPVPVLVELRRRDSEICGQWTVIGGKVVYDPTVKT